MPEAKQTLFVVTVTSKYEQDADYLSETLEGVTQGLMWVDDIEVQRLPDGIDAIHLVEFKSGQSDSH